MSSNFIRKTYFVEISNLEYALEHPPYIDGSKCFGKIDFIKQSTDTQYVIRGWLFCPSVQIKNLSLTIEDCKYPVYAHKLSRLDVAKVFWFLPNSQSSGFVCLIERNKPIETLDTIGFLAISNLDTTICGNFENLKLDSVE